MVISCSSDNVMDVSNEGGVEQMVISCSSNAAQGARDVSNEGGGLNKGSFPVQVTMEWLGMLLRVQDVSSEGGANKSCRDSCSIDRSHMA